MATAAAAPPATAVPTEARRVPLAARAWYGLGQLAEGAASAAVNTFVFFYFTAVLGLSGTLAGLALAISLAVDAVVDPWIGSLTDRWRSRWGRRHPLMAAGCLPLALTLGLLFSAPQGLSQPALFGWLTLAAIAHRIALSFFQTPYVALGSEMATDYRERSSIMTIKAMFNIAGTLAALMLGYLLWLGGPQGMLAADAYPGLGWSCAAVALVAATLSVWKTRHLGADLAPPETAAMPRNLAAEVREIFANRSFRVLFAGLVLFFAALGMHLALALHVNNFFWRLTPAQIQLLTLAYFLGLAAGVPTMPLLTRQLEKRSIVLLAVGMLALAWALPPSLRLLGLLDVAPAALPPLLSGPLFVAGLGATWAGIAYTSMMGDAAEEHELLFGTRREGLYFAGLGFAGKAASGLGTLLGGAGLDLIGFPRSLAGRNTASVDVPPATLDLLGLVYGPGTALVVVLSMLTLLGYRIDRRRHAEIAAGLRQLRHG